MVATEPSNVKTRGTMEIPRPEAAMPWPIQAEMILSAIEAGQFTRRERRASNRAAYRVQAYLKLFSDGSDEPARTLYTRDIDSRGIGFITPHRLPLGYGGVLEIVFPDGSTRQLPGTLYRCREAAPGWFEGALHFNRHQTEFSR